MTNYFIYNSPLGKIAIAETGGKIIRMTPAKNFNAANTDLKETPTLKEAARQLAAYFDGKLKNFDLPLAPQGTTFQKKVWAALCKVPCGQTRTYGDIARDIKNPKAVRAVGGANNRNPIFIIIPCHRIIGADGSMTGYALGLKTKKYLLAHESR